MIAYVSGRVLRTESNAVVISNAGVGYFINVSPAVALSAKSGETLELHTELIVREDSQTLYGFTSADELGLFQTLLKVSGVGPKSALAILGTMGVQSIRQAVSSEDDEAFKRVPGVGPKTAKLICVQLSGRIAGSSEVGTAKTERELLEALTGLGYSAKVALDAIKKSNASTLPISEGLRLALASLSRKATD